MAKPEKTDENKVTEAPKSATAEAEGAKEPKEKKIRTPRPAKYQDADKIHFGVKTEAKPADGETPATAEVKYDADANNPKRAGSASRDRFAAYSEGITVGELVEKIGDRSKVLGDLKYDEAHGFITVEYAPRPKVEEKPAEAKEPAPAA